MFRILTEDKNRPGILSILDSYVDGYIVTPVIGSWKGTRESTLAIDLVGVDARTVQNIARVIKWENTQESVLILDLNAVSTFI